MGLTHRQEGADKGREGQRGCSGSRGEGGTRGAAQESV